jgi:predicted nucleotide-binding protein (sugar kinase/HSP70/actin superfamily)
MKRVGIPRALLFYRYGDFWQSFFHKLGFEVILSPKSDNAILAAGLSRVSSEVCLPIKLLAGHIAALAGRVDYLFLPRLISNKNHLYACPKMIGIVDVVRLQIGRSVKLLIPDIRRGLAGPHVALGSALTGNPVRALAAYRAARAHISPERALPDFPVDRLKVAFLCHFYIVGDDFIAQDILDVFKKAKVRIYTKEDLPQKILSRSFPPRGVAESIQWIFERELYNAFEFYEGKVDGICNIVSFGCGPDSLVSELMVREAKVRGLPFLQLIIDEHTGKTGLVTRVEAFLELVERAKRRRGEGLRGSSGEGERGRNEQGNGDAEEQKQ